MARDRSAAGRTHALDLAGEAMHLVRAAPPVVWAAYLAGAVPFVLAFLYFWAEMSHGAAGRVYLAEASLLVTLGFFWMKCWQAVYCSLLRDRLRGRRLEPWSAGRVATLLTHQVTLQALGLVLRPLGLVSLVLFERANAFFQTATAVGDGTDAGLVGLLGRVRRLAWGELNQSLGLTWLLSPWLTFLQLLGGVALGWLLVEHGFYLAPILILLLVPVSPVGLLLAVNLAVALVFVPTMVRTLTGVESALTLSGLAAVGNTTFLATVCALVYLCMDPVLKAAYTVRAFQRESLTTGEDLLAELRRLRAEAGLERRPTGRPQANGARVAAVLALLLLGATAAAGNEPPSLEAERLDRRIEDVLALREFTWRASPDGDAEHPAAEREPRQTWLTRLAVDIAETLQRWGEAVGDWLDGFLRWLRGLQRGTPNPPVVSPGASSGGFAWAALLEVLIWMLLIVAVVFAAGLIAYRILRGRKDKGAVAAESVPEATVTPDLESEDLTADELPADQWLEVARDLFRKGQGRLAVRALFLGNLAWLGERELVRIARFKSNRDYSREIGRRAHAWPGLLEAFREGVGTYEHVWYGSMPVSERTFDRYQESMKKVRSRVETP